MSRVVLDASVVIAFLKNEPGGDVLPRDGALISSITLAEIVSVFVRKGASLDEVRRGLQVLGLHVIDFDEASAEQTGALILFTQPLGLSLADRACLALAKREGVPVLTADRAWRGLDIGVEIQLIR